MGTRILGHGDPQQSNPWLWEAWQLGASWHGERGQNFGLSSLGGPSQAESASTSSSVGSWEFPLPREGTTRILILVGAKDFDFFLVVFLFFFTQLSQS